MKKKSCQNSLHNFYKNVREILQQARENSYRAINFEMVKAYWKVGQVIIEEEQKGEARAQYGKFLIKRLSEHLSAEVGKGFSARNLRYMREFYRTFPKWELVRPSLSWTHYCLLCKVENETARFFYMNEAIQQNWSTRQLERQIHSFYYERILASQDKKTVQKEVGAGVLKPEDLIKDPYILEFLNLREQKAILEKDLERELISKLQEFLLELGKGFCFVARQQRISTELSHCYIDLVFYNYLLKCFVLIDLKIGKLSHQDIGQMDMYVRMYEDLMKPAGDNPTVGIILCSEKDETVVKYSILEESKQLFASKYKLYLPSEEEFVKELERERWVIQTH